MIDMYIALTWFISYFLLFLKLDMYTILIWLCYNIPELVCVYHVFDTRVIQKLNDK